MLSNGNIIATLQHLVAATLAPGRGLSANELLPDLAPDNDLRDGPAALDSLNQLAVARRVTEFFELNKAGTEEMLLRRRRLGQWSTVIAESLDDGTLTHLWFRTGGTTGEPRLIPQPITHLLSEAREISRLVSGTQRILSLAPLHHIYGFIWGPLLSHQLTVPLVHGPDAVQAAHHDLRPGDLLLGIPEWWQYFASAHHPLPEGVTGVTSTAPCPPRVIRDALGRGLVSMIEVYGSSETAGIGWRDNLNRGFQLFDHWQRQDNDHLQCAEGRVYPLPDSVRWETDRLLIPVKRHDHAIQVGGCNVWPDRIRAFIERHAKVKACAVRPMETEHGTRLKGFIVPMDTDQDDSLQSLLRAWINTHLPPPERPVHLTFGAELPRNPMGKLCDW